MQFTIFYLFSGPPVAIPNQEARANPSLLHIRSAGASSSGMGCSLRIKLYVITYMAIIFVLELFQRLLSGAARLMPLILSLNHCPV